MKRPAVLATAIMCFALPAAAAAHLPAPDSTRIIPGVGMGDVKLDMTKAEVVSNWGPASQCLGGARAGACYWWLPHHPPRGEVASVSLRSGHVDMISIRAAQTRSGAFRSGFLSHWATRRGHIHLGSPKRKVDATFGGSNDPGILRANNSTGVGGFDYFLHVDRSTGATNSNTTDTRFGTPGLGPTPNLLWGITISWACPRPSGPCAPVPP